MSWNVRNARLRRAHWPMHSHANHRGYPDARWGITGFKLLIRWESSRAGFEGCHYPGLNSIALFDSGPTRSTVSSSEIATPWVSDLFRRYKGVFLHPVNKTTWKWIYSQYFRPVNRTILKKILAKYITKWSGSNSCLLQFISILGCYSVVWTANTDSLAPSISSDHLDHSYISHLSMI